MRTWHVYRLIDPRTGKPFYVGCTAVAKDRFQVHVDDPAVAARSRCRQLRDLGLHPRLKIVRAFDGKLAAYEFACWLILTTRGLVNAPLEFVRWPRRSALRLSKTVVHLRERSQPRSHIFRREPGFRPLDRGPIGEPLDLPQRT
jgi:hypothetical protein